MSLPPSTRIKLIEAIAQNLSQKDYALIDLTLNGFGLSTTLITGDTKLQYVINAAKQASDAVLPALASHLGIPSALGATVDHEAPTFWIPHSFKLFVSHISSQRGRVAALQEALAKFSISCFVAHKDIEPTAEWEHEIEKALRSCDALLALLHAGFHASKWTDQEVGYAVGREVLVLPLNIDETPYGFMARYQAMDGKNKGVSDAAQEIFDILRKHVKTRYQMADILIDRFEHSTSFADAKANIGLLEEMQIWGPTFSQRCLAAIDGNSQVRDSYHVPGRVEKLVAKWEPK